MPTITLPYKHDPSAGGPIPAHIHYSTTTSSSNPTPKPIILIFHAGGFAAGSTNLIPQSQITHLTDTLNAVAIAPEYRLCPQVSLRAGPVADAHACLAWARETLPRALAAATGGAVLADPARVGVMGHSAGGMLALELGNAESPPSAILDFYGVKYLGDAFWGAPLASFAGMPDPDAGVRAKVYEEETVAVSAGAMFVDGRPDLKTPRSAWMIHAIKHGKLYEKCLRGPASKDEDAGGEVDAKVVEEVEPTRGFKKSWPPTCFVHGTEDVFVPFSTAERAERELKEKDAEVELIKVHGAGHVFDMALGKGDVVFESTVAPALKWLVERV